MELIPGVHAIEKLSVGRSYLVLDADRVTVIDTSQKGNGRKIIDAVIAAGRRPQDVKHIVITHYHSDHAGSMSTLARRTGAQILAHRLDAEGVRGYPAGKVDRELEDNDMIDALGGMQVVHTPGHTPGSISLYCPGPRVLFVGDAAMNMMGVRAPFKLFTEDMAEAKRSMRKLAALDFEVVCFGHGNPLNRDATARFRRAVERIAK